jgi:predicted CXXCH cytochrome family protein
MLAAALLATTCSPHREARGPASPVPVGEVRSNVLRGDYAGSAACEPCHADEYAAWQASAMHQMTRLAKSAHILAPFDGAVFRFKEDSARLEQVGAERFMTITSAHYGSKRYRVTKVIGGHYREDFAGVEVNGSSKDGTSPATAGSADVLPAHLPTPERGRNKEELVLPVTYLLGPKTLRYKGYSVMLKERDGLRAGPEWSKTCILCHNTAPYLTSLLGAIAGPKARAYQGETVDALLPSNRRWSFRVTDEALFRDALNSEIAHLHDGSASRTVDGDLSAPEAAAVAIDATRANLSERHLVEIGIGCESCHGGSKEHVKNPRVHPSFEPRAPFLQRQPSDATRAELVTRACARCHQVLFSGYPHTWEGGARRSLPGGSNINSGEARDFLLGACGKSATCTDCHDPHTRESGGRTREIDTTAAGNAVCTRCHQKYRERDAIRAHTRHDPDREGGRCVGCHMPKKNMSLDSGLTRYHHISSPTDRTRVERDRPLECALCHTDKSVGAILEDMSHLFGKRYDESALRVLYPDFQKNALLATLELGKPHEQAVAIHLLGEARMKAAAPLIAQQMTHAYPILRPYAARALESIVGSKSPVDLNQDDGRIDAATREWLAGRAASP